MLRKYLLLLIATSVAVSATATASAPSQSPHKLPRAHTGNGYAICGSCSVPKDISWRVALAPKGEPGEPMVLSGTIYKEDGVTPASGITLFLYQADAGGYYHRPTEDVFDPTLRGWLRTGKDGRYEIRTVKPAPEVLALDEPAHIHAHAFGPGIPEHFLKEFWFQGDPRIKASEAKAAAGLGTFSPIVQLTRNQRGEWVGMRDIRLKPTKQWGYQDE